MTDEDDRMDRARRIREMREGTRDAQADDATDEADDANTDPPSPTDPDDGGDDAGSAPDGSGDPVERTDDGSDDADGGGLHIPGADVEDVEIDVADLAERAGLETSDVEADEEAVAGPVGMAGAGAADKVERTAETRVLEFDLGSERYCLDIEHVEEIVKRETVTRVPNTPEYVAGVVDLRGQITTILDPKVLLDIEGEGSQELIVVFDPDGFEDQGAIGWIVDDVNQVRPVAEAEVNPSPVDAAHVNGVVERDGEFVVWTDPDVAIEDAAG